VKAASKAAKVSRTTAYRHRDAVQTFRKAWDEALEEACDGMELEAHRRAVKGVRKPVYQQTKLAGYVREHSDGLLMFLLKAHRPEKFAQQVRHAAPGGGPIRHEVDLEQRRQAARDLEAYEREQAGGDSGDE